MNRDGFYGCCIVGVVMFLLCAAGYVTISYVLWLKAPAEDQRSFTGTLTDIRFSIGVTQFIFDDISITTGKDSDLVSNQVELGKSYTVVYQKMNAGWTELIAFYEENLYEHQG